MLCRRYPALLGHINQKSIYINMLNNKLKPIFISLSVAAVITLSSCAIQKTSTQVVSPDDSQGPLQPISNNVTVTRVSKTSASDISIDQPAEAQAVNDIWVRLRNNFSFDLDIDNKAIREQRNWYLKHPAYFQRISSRAERYLYYVANSIEAQGLPAELALLPIVESAYDPFAYSHGRASGMWQFIPGTGKRFGLDQNWWYDGRRDVVRSTDAALEYLILLNKRFDGDWLLALAAYNSGGGNVNKAITRNRRQGKATDFWSLQLPRETKAYVPKMIALAQILKDPERYGVTFPAIPDQPYFKTVDVGSQIDLAQAADLANIELNELYLLNPGFNQWATSPDGPHQLNVPVDKADNFALELAQLPKDKRVNWLRYTIKSGDTISTIAAHYRTTPRMLRQVNNLQSNKIRAGKVLFVPVASQGTEQYVLSATERLKKKQNRTSRSNRIKQIHITQAGDSFWEIARHYGVNTRDVARWNNLGTSDTLRVGQKLVIWSKADTTASSRDRQLIRKVGYQVRPGDSLARIAQKFNIKISDIEGWNGITRNNYLQPGQALKLYVDITRASL